ncbi:AAA family ATPase [Janthinobacterium sp. LB3P118]|uniref:AAA family ATPase n=1 Tax=Janthinobacterium sp. LB3P118 TaxID=3424195 RepID=UPI003F29D86A
MILTALKAQNYKSYFEVQDIAIESGFNLFIGGNNSGKTSMLEAVDFDASKHVPHLSRINAPTYGIPASGYSELFVEVRSTIQEIADQQNGQIFLPVAENYQQFLSSGNAAPVLTANPYVTMTFGHGSGHYSLVAESALGRSAYASTRGGNNLYAYDGVLDRSSGDLLGSSFANYGGGYPAPLHEIVERFRPLFYRFSAHRRISGQCHATSHPVKLESDAANLPYCLNNFQSTDPYGYSTLCKLINRVFPSVAWVQGAPKPNNLFEAFCLPMAPESRRDDLAVPLSLMGSGIGNVIAILYVVITSRFPQVIAIDEPNSFLHPKALRELLQILAVEGAQHQYILTAHSADVMTAIKPTLVTMFSAMEGRTTVRQVGTSDIADLRADLSDLGIRMTDLHGRDRVLWVEGQTEELVIPELLRYFCPTAAAGTAVLRVEHTGTFEKKKGISASEVAAIYKRLSQSSALVPPMVGILLDREGKLAADCAKVERESTGTLRFLDRTMLEDYVLDADAIASILSELGENCTSQEVADILAESGSEETAATKLENIFNSISEARHTFRKTRDTPSIVTWLLTNKPSYLQPLGTLLASIVEAQATSSTAVGLAPNV